MQRERFINLGFGNFVVASRVVSIVNPASAPMRRLREDAKAILPDTLGQRFAQEEDDDA